MLNAYYHSPAWSALRATSDRTRIRVDSVHLLRPTHPLSGIVLGERPVRGAASTGGIVVVTRYTFDDFAAPRFTPQSFVEFFYRRMMPRLFAAGARPIATFVTHHQAGEPLEYSETAGWHARPLPGLPLRERRGEFIWFARFSDVAAAERSAAALEHDLLWADFQETLSAFLAAPVQVWRLAPIGRSAAFR